MTRPPNGAFEIEQSVIVESIVYRGIDYLG
jgi:hypothetical protein